METKNKAEQIHEAFLKCKEVFTPSMAVADAVFDINDDEERQFYNMVYQFFLQKRQKELIEKGVF